MRRPNCYHTPAAVLETPDMTEATLEDDLESSIRSCSMSTRRIHMEPPVDSFVAFDDTRKIDHAVPSPSSTLSYSCSRLFMAFLMGVGLCSGSFYMGARWQDESRIHKTVLDEALSEAQAEVLQDQEAMVLELAKLRRELKLQKEEIQEQPEVSSSKKDDEFTALYHHVELLKKNLNLTTHKLNEERRFREEAEANVQEAWGSYELHTSQLKAVHDKQAADLSALFENLLSEEFGMGPFYVQFQMHLPTDEISSLPHQDCFFTVELFPTMPTSSFYFLKQVQQGSWNGRFFHYNDPHFLLTDLTMSSDSISSIGSSFARQILSSQRDSLDTLMSTGLAHLPFNDYRESIPHAPYSLGFRAVDNWKDRPGPAFFINKLENSDFHKGQPCFGQVVLGRHVVDSMGERRGPENSPSFIKPIEIVSADILEELSDAVGGEEYLSMLEKKQTKDEI